MLLRKDRIPVRHFQSPCKSTFDRSVVVHVYAVKNDLTNWESNLGLDKPFMTNGEFLESLELNENNIPTINGTGKDLQSYFCFFFLNPAILSKQRITLYMYRSIVFVFYIYTHAHDKKSAFVFPRIV